MRWRRRRRRQYIDWDSWQPMRMPTIDWETYRLGNGDPPRFPRWGWSDWCDRPLMEPEEFYAMPWWDRLRFNLTEWDPRDISKFPPPDIGGRDYD